MLLFFVCYVAEANVREINSKFTATGHYAIMYACHDLNGLKTAFIFYGFSKKYYLTLQILNRIILIIKTILMMKK